MNEMWGANVAELQRLGAEFEAKGQAVMDLWPSVRAVLNQTSWDGPDAQAFRHAWDGEFKQHLTRVGNALKHAGAEVQRQASDQLRTSSTTGGTAPSPAFPKGHLALPALIGGSVYQRSLASFYSHLHEFERGDRRVPSSLSRMFPELPWALRDGREELVDVRDQPPSAQAAWWEKLGSERQRALLIAYPGMLAGLAGLPPAVRAGALEQFGLSRRGEVASRIDAQSVEVSTNLGVFKAGAEASATLKSFRSGEAEVTLNLTGDLAKEFASGTGSAGVGLEGGVSVTYRFVDVNTAQQFIDGLKSRLDPNIFEAIAGDDLISYLRTQTPESTVVSLAATASTSMKIDGNEVHLSGEAGVTWDIDSNARTVYVEVGAGASVGGSGGDVSGKVALSLNEKGDVVGATLSGRMGVTTGMSVDVMLQSVSGDSLAGGGAAVSAGNELGYTAEIDVSDPRVRAQLIQLVEHPGDAAAIKELLRLSEAQVSVNTMTSASAGGTVLGTGATTSTSSVSNQVTYVKPPEGNWTAVP